MKISRYVSVLVPSLHLYGGPRNKIKSFKGVSHNLSMSEFCGYSG